MLALLNSGQVELLDDRRLVAQIRGLERRTAWGGRDSIDHGPGGHDDLANATLGAVLLATATRRRGGGMAAVVLQSPNGWLISDEEILAVLERCEPARRTANADGLATWHEGRMSRL